MLSCTLKTHSRGDDWTTGSLSNLYPVPRPGHTRTTVTQSNRRAGDNYSPYYTTLAALPQPRPQPKCRSTYMHYVVNMCVPTYEEVDKPLTVWTSKGGSGSQGLWAP